MRSVAERSEPSGGGLQIEIGGPLAAPVNAALRTILQVDRINALYRRARPAPGDSGVFQRILDQLGIGYHIESAELERIPQTGPLVVAANHPHGLPEGLILGALLSQMRPDVKIMVNLLLGGLEELRDRFLLVNPFRSSRANRQPLRECLRWLDGGGALVVFPAGEVSHLDLRTREVADPPWTDTAARLIRISGAAALPAYVAGANSLSFQLLGVVHPGLRTLRILHEMLSMRGREVRLRIGHPIRHGTLLALGGDREITRCLRARTYLLGSRGEAPALPVPPPLPLPLPRLIRRQSKPVVRPAPPELAAAEVAALPPQCVLADSGEFQALLVDARMHPQLMRETGRLRELTFRAAGEGSGRELDLDRFDDLYQHLVLWHKKDACVAGGYRLGSTADILPRHGVRGLYTGTLFDYRPEFFSRIGTALEMGRSFVCPEYQRHMQPLLMLWKGIGAYVCRRPEHKILFGPVSISSDYRPVTRKVLAESLAANCTLAELEPLVKPRRPFRTAPIHGMRLDPSRLVIGDLEELNPVVTDLEPDGKGVPILIRQYLKLGGRMLGFNVDPAFSNTLDALILVDLRKASRPVLERYMGKAGAAGFLEFHGAGRSTQ